MKICILLLVCLLCLFFFLGYFIIKMRSDIKSIYNLITKIDKEISEIHSDQTNDEWNDLNI